MTGSVKRSLAVWMLAIFTLIIVGCYNVPPDLALAREMYRTCLNELGIKAGGSLRVMSVDQLNRAWHVMGCGELAELIQSETFRPFLQD